MYTRVNLLSPARSLCVAFSSGASIPELLTHFTHDPYPIVHEHGLPGLAPFLGRTFSGVDGISRYFELIGRELAFENMQFDPESEWVVDTETMAVVLRGTARFMNKKTGEGWDETFVYRLGMAQEITERGKMLKVQEYLIWADTGAAYLARMNKLKEVQGGPRNETMGALDRKRSGCGEVVGSGLNAYGSCGQ